MDSTLLGQFTLTIGTQQEQASLTRGYIILNAFGKACISEDATGTGKN
jgi:hypothetical protein